jgi:N-acetylneuraminic acid mutarotase
MQSCSRPYSAGLVSLLLIWTLVPARGQILWTTTGSLAQPRFQTTGTLLNDGRVLLVGSLTCDPGCFSYPTAEIYDPSTGTWSETSPLNVPRFNHVAVRLPDGRVLVAGGYLTPGVLTASCEIFDPATGLWTLTGSLNTPRQFHQAAALANGKVLVVGGLGMNGQGSFLTLASAELYDPASGQWSPAGSLGTARFEHTVTLLADGRVLVAGGTATAAGGQNQGPFASAELYDLATNSWKAAAPMSAARDDHAATLLNNGQVLVTGGWSSSGSPSFTAELYNPVNDTWVAATRMRAPRAEHTATLLPDGHVLVVGGGGNWVVAEAYDPDEGTWSPAPELDEGRASHSATLLNNGAVLVAGGVDITSTYLTSAELLDPTDRRPLRQ